MILRVVLQLTDGAIGKFANADGSSIGYTDNYTGNHIAIFEAMLRSPPSLALADNTYENFINEHRLNFKNWKLVDLDNFMSGNPHYSEFVSADTWAKRNDKLWSARKINTIVSDDNEGQMESFEKLVE